LKIPINKNILNEVETFSNSLLKRRADLQIIIDESLQHNFDTEFEELTFTSKYIQGLKRVLKKGADFQEIDNLDHVKKDLTENMEKVIGDIRALLIHSSEINNKHFEDTYLSLTPNCFQNLNELLEDLEWVKKYLNYQKRSDNN
jgi:3-dehydroquinate synthetase